MDGAVSTRKYPAYTTAQLEAFVASGNVNLEMMQEIEDRKSGASKPLVVPQVARLIVRTQDGQQIAVDAVRAPYLFDCWKCWLALPEGTGQSAEAWSGVLDAGQSYLHDTLQLHTADILSVDIA